jgi:hypothetical protein
MFAVEPGGTSLFPVRLSLLSREHEKICRRCPLALLGFGVWITPLGVTRSSPLLLRGRRRTPPPEVMRMDDSADRFLELIHQLEDFTHSISPEQAHSEFDETTLQLFWMRWPQLSAWSGSLWRLLSEELAGPSAPHDSELFEMGESG